MNFHPNRYDPASHIPLQPTFSSRFFLNLSLTKPFASNPLAAARDPLRPVSDRYRSGWEELLGVPAR